MAKEKELKPAETAEKKTKPAAEGKVYTYVGQGEDPPRKIKFMGIHDFVRGKATEVTHPAVLAKIAAHPCFVEGEVDNAGLHDQDEAAAKKAEEQRIIDKKTNAAFQLKHKTE